MFPLKDLYFGMVNQHYHDSNNNKYYYDIDNNTFYDQKTGELATKGIQKLLKDKEFMKGIKKALQILGE